MKIQYEDNQPCIYISSRKHSRIHRENSNLLRHERSAIELVKNGKQKPKKAEGQKKRKGKKI